MGTPTRNAILRGFLDLRSQLLQIQINGFQWVSGSFVEDIETQEGRDPNDVDVVTFVSSPADSATLNAKIIATNAQLLDHTYVKATYRVDHFWVPLGTSPQLLVSIARYWYGLFSHRRDRVWKGMLVVELRDSADDQSALALLGVQP